MPSDDRTTYLIWRIVGNDLPPRHTAGSTLENVRFILEHEPEFPSCAKRWLLNRIVDPEFEAALIARFEAHGVPYDSRPLDADAVHRGSCRYEQILRAIDINGARNEIIDRGARSARYTIPLDGNTFFTPAAWGAFTEVVGRHEQASEGRRYFSIPMARTTSHEAVLDPSARIEAGDEPQLAFRHDAALRFDERYRYGYRDKMELLLRLGKVPGFLRGEHAAPHRYTENEARCPDAGYVLRLPSAPTDGHSLPSKERMRTRDAALDAFLARATIGLPPRSKHRAQADVLRLPGAPDLATVEAGIRAVLGEPGISKDIVEWTEAAGLTSSEEAAALYACVAYGEGPGSVVQLGGAAEGAAACLAAGNRRSGGDPSTHISVRPYPRPVGYDPAAEHELAHQQGRAWKRPLRLLSIDGNRSYGDLMEEVFVWARHLAPHGFMALSGIDPSAGRTGGRRFYKDWLDNHTGVEPLFVARGLAIVRPDRPLAGPFGATDIEPTGKTRA